MPTRMEPLSILPPLSLKFQDPGGILPGLTPPRRTRTPFVRNRFSHENTNAGRRGRRRRAPRRLRHLPIFSSLRKLPYSKTRSLDCPVPPSHRKGSQPVHYMSARWGCNPGIFFRRSQAWPPALHDLGDLPAGNGVAVDALAVVPMDVLRQRGRGVNGRDARPALRGRRASILAFSGSRIALARSTPRTPPQPSRPGRLRSSRTAPLQAFGYSSFSPLPDDDHGGAAADFDHPGALGPVAPERQLASTSPRAQPARRPSPPKPICEPRGCALSRKARVANR